MSEPNKYREWILETIDSLRSRKARPDLERICRMVRRRHGSDPDRTRTELEKLIQEQTVLKVSYKGSISYRNAAKVQRKSRKKSEFITSAVGGGGGAEAAARERTKHDHLNNNGDSAHSFTDQEEGEEPEPSPDPHTQTSGTKLKPASCRSSGNGCLNCGATTGCAVGSGCKEEKASAPRDKGLEHQAAGGCPEPGVGHGTSAHGDGSRATPSRSDAVCGGMEPGPSGAESQNKTYTGSVSSLPQQQPRQPAPLKPKLRVGGGGTRVAGTHANSADLGDRLVASVRRLSERSHRGGSAAAASSTAATRGHMKPLGLKEILGYLSSQEQLSEEKLTRGKVKVVMEREVARGRLRRTRCGNITLPLRGMVMVEEPASKKNASADRLGKSALQEKHTPTKKPPPSSPVQEHEPMEASSEEVERGENDEENEEEEEEEDADDPRSSDEEGGPTPVAMTTEPGLTEKPAEDAEIQAVSEEGSPHQQPQHSGKAALSGVDSLARTPSPPVQGVVEVLQCSSECLEERADLPDQPHMAAQTQSQPQHDGINHTSSGFNNMECMTEVGVSSCLLTPTASPRDSGLSEELGINGGVGSGGFMKCEGASGSPMDWTVSDVVSYFTAAGFPEQAAAFMTQEIDGKSLLLMQRNDVLTGLSIRLGPALKIYERHVKVLQKTHFEDDDC
ncbi:sterile alpha motif domain-containing protein 1 [Pleuronectes platessa]|uniref:sterile alpha motif domain-containing protein 1 n=1 Tax=Pleuronectes platessa TaxID=8262 RepID=UPI00232A1B0E|nr:sterile alpha motif domain-containing protein 1 [Pleuronectes platessa]